MSNYVIYNDELYHHGVKGMKWGVRRYQNKDGSLTNAGRKQRSTVSDEQKAARKKTAKKVVAVSAMALTVAAAGVLYAKNPAVSRAVNAAASKTMSSLKSGSGKAVKVGKKYAKEALNGVKEGVKEGVKDAPKKATKAIITGVTLNAAKRALDSAVGKEEAARIFQAANSKKVSSFWKVNDDRDKDDD